AFMVWTLPPRLPLGILSLDSRTARSGAGRIVVWFGANYVGRNRGDASDPAVVHITGTQRTVRAWHRRTVVDHARSGRRFAAAGGDLGLPQPQPSGIRGADHGTGTARL